ncbi:MAG TPA: GNAT family N-acetyltransferase [Solirubrobacteraceae bacterium]|nr:GNAT family N-acetyltransferase [Solirubrobacteraceae bacterium]
MAETRSVTGAGHEPESEPEPAAAAASPPEDPFGEGTPATARLRDGSAVTLRVVEAADAERLRAFLAALGLEARRLRFFTGGVDVEAIARSVTATGPDRIGVLALDAAGEVVGHALCVTLEEGTGEVAVEVADGLHGQGLGTILLELVAELAERRGTDTLVAAVLPDNAAMLEVFRDAFGAVAHFHDGTDTFRFPAAAWRAARRRYPQPFLRPGSISPRSSA